MRLESKVQRQRIITLWFTYTSEVIEGVIMCNTVTDVDVVWQNGKNEEKIEELWLNSRDF